MVGDRCLALSSTGKAEVSARALGVLDGRIAASASADELRRGALGELVKRAGTRIFELGEDVLVPSFVNAHTHLAMAPLRGITDLARRKGNVVSDVFFALESEMTAADVRAFTRMGAWESVLSGVGEVWDHFYFGESIAEGLVDAGLTGVVAPTLQDLAGPGAMDSEAQLEATLRIAESSQFRGAGVRAALGPHATDTVSEELLERARDVALAHGLAVHMHAAQALEEVRSFEETRKERRGEGREGIANLLISTFSQVPLLVAHGLHFSAEECAKLAQHEAVLAYCPYSQLQFGVLSPFSSWLEGGGKWVLGTDCVASNDALDVQRELALVGGNAALRASFSSERERLVAGGGADASAEVEAVRKSLLEAPGCADPHCLLEAAWGLPLSGWSAGSRALGVGSLANFLVLDEHHPALFPGDDMLRTLAYGSTAGAIKWSCTGGRLCGLKDGLARELLNSAEYRDGLDECVRRRDELFARAKMSPVRSSS